MKYVRLLPAVILVSFMLLGLKGEGLIRSAWAQGQANATGSDVLAKDTAALPSDPAAEETNSDSAGEVDVQSALTKRRQALDAREADLEMRSQVLAAAEARVDAKIATLKQLQDQITTLLGQRDDAEKAQITALVKTYSAMKPRDAARIFNNLSDDVLVPVAQAMKADVLAQILANMNSDNAQKLTLKLASRLKLPDTTAALAAQANPAQPAAPQAAPAAKAAK
jgi:flagellar motility protein MotE (MotC chaperone)